MLLDDDILLLLGDDVLLNDVTLDNADVGISMTTVVGSPLLAGGIVIVEVTVPV